MKKQLKPRNPSSAQVENKIQSDHRRYYSFLLERKGSIPFTPPPKDWLNGMLANHIPMPFLTPDGKVSPTGKGNVGFPTMYYIPKAIHEKLTQTFDEFEIPDEHRPNLTWAFLNMAFASCMAVNANTVHRQQQEWDKDYVEFMELLPHFESEKKILRGFTLVFQDRTKHPTDEGRFILGKLTSRTFGIGTANSFMEELLQNYKNAARYDHKKWWYDLLKRVGKKKSFGGYKNAEKEQQSYYGWSVFEFLREVLFRPALEFYGDDKKYSAKLRELKRKYSRRNRFIFIGRLLALSGLLYEKAEFDDEELFDTIRKKVAPGLRAEKRKYADLRKQEAQATDGKRYIFPYSSQF